MLYCVTLQCLILPCYVTVYSYYHNVRLQCMILPYVTICYVTVYSSTYSNVSHRLRIYLICLLVLVWFLFRLPIWRWKLARGFVSPVIKQVEHSFGRRVHGASDPWKRDGKLVCNEGFKIHSSLVLINGAQQTWRSTTNISKRTVEPMYEKHCIVYYVMGQYTMAAYDAHQNTHTSLFWTPAASWRAL